MVRSTEIPVILDSKAWDDDYTRRGMLWSGVTGNLPDLSEGSHILELGCGNGKAVKAMICRGWNVTAVDSSPAAVALFRQVIRTPLRSLVMVADGRSSPFKDAVFDAVFVTHVIGHMQEPDRRSTAGEVARVLRPGGTVFFCEFSRHDFRFGMGCEIEEATFRRGNNIITHYFSVQEVLALFSELTPVSIDTREWPMRVRGCSLRRSEITAVFTSK